MKKIAVLLLFGLLGTHIAHSQTINPDIFKKNIAILYDAAMNHFKEIKLEETGEIDGKKKFGSSKKISGADEVYILVDGETTHTYHATFTGSDLEETKQKIEEMVALMREVLAEKGLVHGTGTDIKFEGYRKQTFQYDSDNIDLLGKYSSFDLGIRRGSEPPVIELTITEPLWK